MAILYDGLTEDGNRELTWRGGKGTFFIKGDLGGGTLELQIEVSEGSWLAVSDASFTDVTVSTIELMGSASTRIVLSGSTTPDFECGWL